MLKSRRVAANALAISLPHRGVDDRSFFGFPEISEGCSGVVPPKEIPRMDHRHQPAAQGGKWPEHGSLMKFRVKLERLYGLNREIGMRLASHAFVLKHPSDPLLSP